MTKPISPIYPNLKGVTLSDQRGGGGNIHKAEDLVPEWFRCIHMRFLEGVPTSIHYEQQDQKPDWKITLLTNASRKELFAPNLLGASTVQMALTRPFESLGARVTKRTLNEPHERPIIVEIRIGPKLMQTVPEE